MQFKNLEQFLCVNFDQTFLSPNTGGKHSAQEDIPKLRFWLLVFQSLNLNHAELLILVLNVKGPLFYSFVFFFNSSQKLINHISFTPKSILWLSFSPRQILTSFHPHFLWSFTSSNLPFAIYSLRVPSKPIST